MVGTPCQRESLLKETTFRSLSFKQDHPASISYNLFWRLPNIFSVEPTFGDELIEILLHGREAILEIHVLGELPVYLHGGLHLPV